LFDRVNNERLPNDEEYRVSCCLTSALEGLVDAPIEHQVRDSLAMVR
jgi:hypothetical protein